MISGNHIFELTPGTRVTYIALRGDGRYSGTVVKVSDALALVSFDGRRDANQLLMPTNRLMVIQ